METNTYTTTPIGYYGSVDITIKNKNRKYKINMHNAGTQALGNLISIALSGDAQNIGSIPNRCPNKLTFDFLQDGVWRPLLSSASPLTSSVWGVSVPPAEDDSQFLNNTNIIGQNRFSTIVNTGSILRGFASAVSTSTTRLCLINNLGEELATLERTGTENNPFILLYTALTSGQDALIDWTMYILNYVTSTAQGGN